MDEMKCDGNRSDRCTSESGSQRCVSEGRGAWLLICGVYWRGGAVQWDLECGREGLCNGIWSAGGRGCAMGSGVREDVSERDRLQVPVGG